MTPTEVGQGVVTGHVTFVWAAYVLSWVVLGGYASILTWRLHRGGSR